MRGQKESRLRKLKESKKKVDDSLKKVGKGVNKALDTVGLGGIKFIRTTGPYEFAAVHRMAKTYFNVVGPQFALIRDFLKGKFGVPGMEPVTW